MHTLGQRDPLRAGALRLKILEAISGSAPLVSDGGHLPQDASHHLDPLGRERRLRPIRERPFLSGVAREAPSGLDRLVGPNAPQVSVPRSAEEEAWSRRDVRSTAREQASAHVLLGERIHVQRHPVAVRPEPVHRRSDPPGSLVSSLSSRSLRDPSDRAEAAQRNASRTPRRQPLQCHPRSSRTVARAQGSVSSRHRKLPHGQLVSVYDDLVVIEPRGWASLGDSQHPLARRDESSQLAPENGSGVATHD